MGYLFCSVWWFSPTRRRPVIRPTQRSGTWLPWEGMRPPAARTRQFPRSAWWMPSPARPAPRRGRTSASVKLRYTGFYQAESTCLIDIEGRSRVTDCAMELQVRSLQSTVEVSSLILWCGKCNHVQTYYHRRDEAGSERSAKG